MPALSAFETARRNMLFGQLICNRIQNTALLNAMGGVPRERFVSDRMQGKAYADETIAVDRTILFSPLIFANLVVLADIHPDDFVLNLHAGTGYSAAVLAKMSRAVVALEDDSSLCENAEKIYIDGKIDNIALFNRAADAEIPKQSPFDVIFIDGIVPRIPENLYDSLADGGRLVAVVSTDEDAAGHAVRVVKNGAAVTVSNAFDVDLTAVNRGETRKKFVFEGIS